MPVFKSYEGELSKQLEPYGKRGAQEGGSNRPPTPATHPDQNEAALENLARKYVNDEQHLLDATLTDVTRTLAQVQQHILAQRSAGNRLLDDDSLHAEVNAHLAADRQSLVELTESKLVREADLNRYRHLNAISDSPDYPDSMLWHLAIIGVCMVLETLANAVFFENEHGLVGGAVVAMLVSMFNIGTAGLFGFLFRYKNLPSIQHKLLGWAAFLAFLAVTLFGNALFSAFRSHYQTVTDPSDAKEVAAAFSLAWTEAIRIFLLDYAPSDMLGFLLFVVGVGLAILAFWKGYTLDDPHPGYGRQHRRYKRALREVHEREGAIRATLSGYLTKRQVDLSAALSAVNTIQSHLSAKVSEMNTARRSLQTQASSIQRDFALVLKAYRDANVAVRVTSPPDYFKTVPDVSAAVNTESAEELSRHAHQIGDDIHTLREDLDKPLAAKLQELKNNIAAIMNDAYGAFLLGVEDEAKKAIAAHMPVIPPSASPER